MSDFLFFFCCLINIRLHTAGLLGCCHFKDQTHGYNILTHILFSVYELSTFTNRLCLRNTHQAGENILIFFVCIWLFKIQTSCVYVPLHLGMHAQKACQSLPDSIHFHGFIELLITPSNISHSSLSHSTFLFCSNMLITSCQQNAVWIYLHA